MAKIIKGKAGKTRATGRKAVASRPLSIKKLDLKDQTARTEFETILSSVTKQLKPVTDPIRDSQRLSKEDFAIRINTRR